MFCFVFRPTSACRPASSVFSHPNQRGKESSALLGLTFLFKLGRERYGSHNWGGWGVLDAAELCGNHHSLSWVVYSLGELTLGLCPSAEPSCISSQESVGCKLCLLYSLVWHKLLWGQDHDDGFLFLALRPFLVLAVASHFAFPL